MMAFQRAASTFCIACICSEVITLLVGSTSAGKCIKAVAGLYILVVLFRLVPGILPALKKAAPNAPASVQLQGTEEYLLQQTQAQLEAALSEECQKRFGTSVGLEIPLTQVDQTVQSTQVIVSIPAGCSPELRKEIFNYLRNELGTEPEWKKQGENG